MIEKYGIILIDTDEVIIQIYEKSSDTWKVDHYRDYDLATFVPDTHPTLSEIVSVIARILVSPYAAHVVDWRILARNIDEETLFAVSNTTSIKSESLTLQREQDLLAKGLLMEMRVY